MNMSAIHTNAGCNNTVDEINNFEDRTQMKGICATSPGWIEFEINREVEFDEIEIGGWKGNSGTWASSNGGGANILTSLDHSNWTNIGTIPSEFANSIVKHKVTNSRARWVKLSGTSYLGIGYFKINRKK